MHMAEERAKDDQNIIFQELIMFQNTEEVEIMKVMFNNGNENSKEYKKSIMSTSVMWATRTEQEAEEYSERKLKVRRESSEENNTSVFSEE